MFGKKKKDFFKSCFAFFLAGSVILNSIPVEADTWDTERFADETTPISDDYSYEEVMVEAAEINALREAGTKHFRLEDGSFTAVMYDADVHYQAEDKEWKEIDNRLSKGKLSDRISRVLNDFRKVILTVEDISDDVEDIEADTSSVTEEDNADFERGESEDPKPEEAGTGEENASANNESVEMPASAPTSALSQRSKTGDLIDISGLPVYVSKNGPVTKVFADSLEQGFIYAESYQDVSVSMLSGGDTEKFCTFFEEIRPELMSTVDPAAKADIRQSEKDSAKDARITLEEAMDISHLSATVSYENAFPGTVLSYESTGNYIKESILIKEKQENYKYGFYLVTDGLIPEKEENGGIILVRKDDHKAVFRIDAPYMYDAFGEASDNVSCTIREAGEYGFALLVEADGQWINAPERAFPVTIDPTLELATGTGSGDITSTYVISGNPDAKQSGYRNLYVGNGSSSRVKQQEIFLHVNRLPQIPESCVPVDAWISYYSPLSSGWSTTGSITKLNLECRELQPSSTPSDWRSYIRNLSWNTKPSYSQSSLDYASMSAGTCGTYVSWNVTEAAKKWYADPSANKGLAVVPAAFDYLSGKAAIGLLYGYGSSYPSRFLVSYRNINGIEDYYTYQTEDVGNAGTAWINDYTDQLTLIRSDLEWESVCNEFSLSHVYSSMHATLPFTDNAAAGLNTKNFGSMKLGDGWKLSVQQSVVKSTADTDPKMLVWNDADGTEHYFHVRSGYPNLLDDEDGLGLAIHRTWPSDCEILYTMYDEDQDHTWEFINGYLTKIRDANGNAIYIAYNNSYSASGTGWYPVYNSSANRISQIVSVPNQTAPTVIADLSYNSSGYLSSITDYNGRVTRYTYTGSFLTGIEDPSGETVT